MASLTGHLKSVASGYGHGLIQPFALPHFLNICLTKGWDCYSRYDELKEKGERQYVVTDCVAMMAGILTSGYFVVRALGVLSAYGIDFEYVDPNHVMYALAATNTVSLGGLFASRPQKEKVDKKEEERKLQERKAHINDLIEETLANKTLNEKIHAERTMAPVLWAERTDDKEVKND